LPGSELFAPITTTDELIAATSDRAWIQAMLDAEAALAHAEAALGVIPAAAAAAIAAACDASAFDAGRLGRAGRAGGNPVIPLVAALTERVAPDARTWVHWGATSQDILDTAAVLIAARCLSVIDQHLTGLADACAALAEEHRSTLMLGRTLLQPALPITFGLKAAGWMVAVLDTRRSLTGAGDRLAAQLGGAAGTLASLGDRGPEVATAFAARLGLGVPVLPWHAARQRMAELACSLGIVAGTAAKISMDVALLMQAEVGEALEPAGPGRGGSSTMPHKRNPVGAAAVDAAARRAHALVPVMLGALVAQHERALGGWHAEWETLSELLTLAGGAAARTAETVSGLEIHPEVMAANLARTPAVMTERVVFALAPELGREAATAAALAQEDAEMPDPAGYLGATNTWIDRALALYREER
jgi:3-carboxy-cis,cis-muconate cycloisomerase